MGGSKLTPHLRARVPVTGGRLDGDLPGRGAMQAQLRAAPASWRPRQAGRPSKLAAPLCSAKGGERYGSAVAMAAWGGARARLRHLCLGLGLCLPGCQAAPPLALRSPGSTFRSGLRKGGAAPPLLLTCTQADLAPPLTPRMLRPRSRLFGGRF